jgi:hypothetical protein
MSSVSCASATSSGPLGMAASLSIIDTTRFGHPASEKLTCENYIIYLDGSIPEPVKTISVEQTDKSIVIVENSAHMQWVSQEQYCSRF